MSNHNSGVGARLLTSGVLVAICFGGCSGGAPSRPKSDGGTGRANGGATATVGGPGRDEDAGMGGATSSGGDTGNGGIVGTGGNTGSGGTTGTGGSTAAGGITGNGGAPMVVSCVKALFGRYSLRNDGFLLYQTDPESTAQTPVIDAGTGMPLANVVAATEGYTHGCAVLGTAKTASCWRTSVDGNNVGQLANGTMDTTGPLFRATQVLTAAGQALTNVVAISESTSDTAINTTCAATGDGRVYCWGNVRWLVNGGMALGSPYAVPITTDGTTPFTGALQIGIAGTFYGSRSDEPTYACAVVQGPSANEVWCWGANLAGNLGTGDTTFRRYPTKIVGVTAPVKVMPFGEGTMCALDGTNVRCWGNNNQGTVGNGNMNTPVLAPNLVTLMGGTTALANIVDIRGGTDGVRDKVCALGSDHIAWCWGWDFQLYPTNYGTTNIVSLGSLDAGRMRFMTGDAVYHILSFDPPTATNRAPNCGLLQ